MGASAGGFARTLLKSADTSQADIENEISQILRDLKIAMFLTGKSSVQEMRQVKHIIREPLKSWVEAYE